MATPRIFLSSTCYDLNEVRDSLYSFIENLGYIPVFSDKNDVFYHPDLHSHESCVKEIENCQIFILIIGGRFGGNYKYDTKRSIVNAEYQTAKQLNIPIFTFIKREVYEDHKVFIINKKKKPDLYDKIEYPSIENQETVINIFEFIDEVRKSDKNNAFFTFEFSRDIREILLKQFAGMFYDFLWNRSKAQESTRTNDLLSNLNLLGKKTEEIIENIYKKVDGKTAISEISKLDKVLGANKFWSLIGRIYDIQPTVEQDRINKLAKLTKSETWFDYLASRGKFQIKEYEVTGGRVKGLVYSSKNKYLPFESLGGEISESHKKSCEDLATYFSDFKSLKESERIKVVSNMQ